MGLSKSRLPDAASEGTQKTDQKAKAEIDAKYAKSTATVTQLKYKMEEQLQKHEEVKITITAATKKAKELKAVSRAAEAQKIATEKTEAQQLTELSNTKKKKA